MLKKLFLISTVSVVLLIGTVVLFYGLNNSELNLEADEEFDAEVDEKAEDMGIKGYITEIDEEHRALVVDTEQNEYGFHNATYVHIPEDIFGIEVGQRVEVIFHDEIIRLSYPAQTGLGDFTIISSEIEGTSLTEPEVVRTALDVVDSQLFEYYHFFLRTVKEVLFEENTGVWVVQIINGDQKEYSDDPRYIVSIFDETGEVMEVEKIE